MGFGILVLMTAIATSAVAAYFSIVGITEIFSYAPAFYAVALMASVLEGAKLVMASALWRYWHLLNKIFKAYLSFALIVLMVITSTGIFGFLSRAHYEAIKDAEPLQAQMDQIDKDITLNQQKITDSQNNIVDIRKSAAEKTVEGYISRTKKALNALESEGTIKSFEDDAKAAQSNIDSLQKKRIELLSQLHNIEAEVGPLKYIAQLIYGSDTYAVMDKAVRIVIVLLVSVFDPLAIALLIVANIILLQNPNESTTRNPNRRPKKKQPVSTASLGKFISVADTKDGVEWKEKKVIIQEPSSMSRASSSTKMKNFFSYEKAKSPSEDTSQE